MPFRAGEFIVMRIRALFMLAASFLVFGCQSKEERKDIENLRIYQDLVKGDLVKVNITVENLDLRSRKNRSDIEKIGPPSFEGEVVAVYEDSITVLSGRGGESPTPFSFAGRMVDSIERLEEIEHNQSAEVTPSGAPHL